MVSARDIVLLDRSLKIDAMLSLGNVLAFVIVFCLRSAFALFTAQTVVIKSYHSGSRTLHPGQRF